MLSTTALCYPFSVFNSLFFPVQTLVLMCSFNYLHNESTMNKIIDELSNNICSIFPANSCRTEVWNLSTSCFTQISSSSDLSGQWLNNSTVDETTLILSDEFLFYVAALCHVPPTTPCRHTLERINAWMSLREDPRRPSENTTFCKNVCVCIVYSVCLVTENFSLSLNNSPLAHHGNAANLENKTKEIFSSGNWDIFSCKKNP